MTKRKLVLENGLTFIGQGFGSLKDAICEIVFNTSMVGYQEIISDLSYHKQFVVMTYPLIGNYGITNEDFESKNPSIGGLIVREYNDSPSNFRYSKTLGETMEEYGIVGIQDIDTRKLVRIIRNEGSMKALITDIDRPLQDCMALIHDYEYPKNQVEEVTCKGVWKSKTPNAKYNVVAVDCGMKLNIVKTLNNKQCNVTVVPYGTDTEQILSYKPDGLFLSNGPGDPINAKQVVSIVQDLQEQIPIFGICLGHQVISLANGAKTYKLKFGHRGGNHPVRNLSTKKVEITSQNHSYAVEEASLKDTSLDATHINILDQTIEGVKHNTYPTFSVQYHPESAPGPQDSDYLFDAFIDNMKEWRKTHA
jgi:carbamoyl-phosphate synthase small subunit